MRKFLEFFGIHCHKWSQWEVFKEGKLLNNYTKLQVGYYITQFRKCKICGYVQIKTEEYY